MGANTLGRMTDMLFEELERLNSIDAADNDALHAEVERSKAMQGMAKEINQSARSQLDAAPSPRQGGRWAASWPPSPRRRRSRSVSKVRKSAPR